MNPFFHVIVPLGVCIWLFILGYLIGSKRSRRFYATGMEWLPVNTIPELDIYDESVFVTDGKTVKLVNKIEYDRHGNPLFSSYKKSKIVGWMPYPKAPNE